MISNSKTIIWVAFIVILVIAICSSRFFSFPFGIRNERVSVDISSSNIIVEAISSDIELYQINGSAPLVEVMSGNKVQRSWTVGDSSTQNIKANESLRVGIPAEYNSVVISTISGDIEGKANAKTIKLSSTSGSIEMRELIGSEFKLNNTSGEIEINAITADTVDIKTVSGSVELDKYLVKDADIATVSGSVEVTTGLPSLNCNYSTTSGSFNQHYTNDPNSNYKLFVTTISGSLKVYSTT